MATWDEFSQYTSPHMSTKLTPFKVLFGCDPPHLARSERGQSPVDCLEEMICERDAILDDLHFN